MRTCVNRIDNELRFKDIDSSSEMKTFFLNDEESRCLYDNSIYIKIDEIKASRNLLAVSHYYNAFCLSSGKLCYIDGNTPVQIANVKLVNDD